MLDSVAKVTPWLGRSRYWTSPLVSWTRWWELGDPLEIMEASAAKVVAAPDGALATGGIANP